MSILPLKTETIAVSVSFPDATILSVSLADGRKLHVPVSWFPRLVKATSEQRANYRFIGGGIGIHWPDIDEDLSVAGLLHGTH